MPTWVPIYDSNTSTDFASVHGPVSANAVLVNGWKDLIGGVWTTASGNLTFAPNVGATIWYKDILYRPAAENAADSRMVVTQTISVSQAAGNASLTASLRWNGGADGSNNNYRAYVGGTGFYIFKDAGTAASGTILTNATIAALVATNIYTLDFSVVGTTLTAILTNVTTSTLVSTLTITDSSYASGGFMLLPYAQNASTENIVTRVQTFNTTPPATFTVAPTIGPAGSTTNVTVTGTNSAWTSGTTFSVSGGTGASVVTNSVNVGAQTASLTITNGSAIGTLTISDSTDAATASYYVIGAHTAVTNSNLYFSPGNWDSDGAGALQANNVKASSNYARTSYRGAYMKVAATSAGSGTIGLQLDTSMLTGISAANCPRVAVSVDKGAFTTTLLSYSATPTVLSLASGLAAGVHTVDIYFQGVVQSSKDIMGDAWNFPTTGASVVKVLGVTLDGSSTIAAATVLSKKLLHFGDSISEGADSVGSANGAGDQDSTVAYPFLLARALGAELALVGVSYQGYEQTGTGLVPAFNTAYNLIASGISRPLTGYDYISVAHGNNGTTTAADVSTMLTNLRAANATAKIFQIVSPSQAVASTITTGFNNYQAATPDANTFLINAGSNFITGLYSNDTLHPNGLRGHPQFAAAIIPLIQNKIDTASGVGGSYGQVGRSRTSS